MTLWGHKGSQSWEEAPGRPEIVRVVAPNPGPMTGAGTNTYLYGSGPCAAIDPGPDDEGHLEAVRAAAEERGGIGIVLLTHSHGDHVDGAERLAEIAAAGSAAGWPPIVLPSDGEEHAGLRALATPGHAADHVCFLTADGVCFSGDLVLGEGSTFVPPDGGSLAAYMDSLRRLQAESLELICPGHGPWIVDPAAKLAEYVEHREMRERRLLAALERGERSRQALLADAWSDVPEPMRPAAALVMEAHLQKLAAEGRRPGEHDAGSPGGLRMASGCPGSGRAPAPCRSTGPRTCRRRGRGCPARPARRSPGRWSCARSRSSPGRGGRS
jgi:glyoxylase-like metal-dependent hydrolase (beta-lactamase superfamily II)